MQQKKFHGNLRKCLVMMHINSPTCNQKVWGNKQAVPLSGPAGHFACCVCTVWQLTLTALHSYFSVTFGITSFTSSTAVWRVLSVERGKVSVLLLEAASYQQIPFHYKLYCRYHKQRQTTCQGQSLQSCLLVSCLIHSEGSTRQSKSTGVIWRLCGHVMLCSCSEWNEQLQAASISSDWGQTVMGVTSHKGSQQHLKVGTEMRTIETREY